MTTEERILDSACRIFSRRGYKNASIKQIAAMAEVNSLTVFRYFHDKEQLFFSALERMRTDSFDAGALNAKLSYTDVKADLMTMAADYSGEIMSCSPIMRIYIGETLNFQRIREEAWFFSPVLKAHFLGYMEKLDKLTPTARDNGEILAEMFISYISKKTLPASKYDQTQGFCADKAHETDAELSAQTACMAFMLTGEA